MSMSLSQYRPVAPQSDLPRAITHFVPRIKEQTAPDPTDFAGVSATQPGAISLTRIAAEITGTGAVSSYQFSVPTTVTHLAQLEEPSAHASYLVSRTSAAVERLDVNKTWLVADAASNVGAMFILSKIADAEEVDLHTFTVNLKAPSGWLALA